MTCYGCGHTVEEGHKFCANCGKSIDNPTDNSNDASGIGSVDSIEGIDNVGDLKINSIDESPANDPERIISEEVNFKNETSIETPSHEHAYESSRGFGGEVYSDLAAQVQQPQPSVAPNQVDRQSVYMQPQVTGQETVRYGIYGEQSTNKKTEKVFFGKLAFIFCLAIIGILSATTSLFAGLYLNTI